MATPDQTRRVTVVGGGIIGISTALHLAQLGVATTLVTSGDLGDGASGRSLSWLNSAGHRSPEYHRLRMEGIERYRALMASADHSSHLGPITDYLRFDGGLTWARPGESLLPVFEYERSIGYQAEWLDRDEVSSRIPGVDPDAVAEEGGLYHPQEGWVDLSYLVEALAEEFVAAGGRLMTHAGPVRFELDDGRAVASTQLGPFPESEALVAAAGAAVPGIVQDLGGVLPDGTPVALLVRTRPVATRLRSVLNTPRVSLRPAPGSGLVMDAGWSERSLRVEPDGTVEVPEGVVRTLLDEASRVLEAHPVLEAQSVGIGPKPIPGDGEPVFGYLPSAPNCYVAFTHSGATLGLVAGELIAREIGTGERSALLDPFGPARFASSLVAEGGATG